MPWLDGGGTVLSPRQRPLHTGCYGTGLPTPPPVTSLPLACAVVLVTRAESQCWVPERPGGWEVTSSRGRCCLATALRLHLLPRLLLLPIPGFADFQALAGATSVLEPNRCILRWSQEPGRRGHGVDCRMRGPGARGVEGTALGVRGPGASWVGSRAEELGTRTPPGRPGELWAVAGHRMGLRRRASHRDFNAVWCRDVLVCFILFYFVRKQTNGLGKCRCSSWRSIVFEYGYMQFIFRGRGEITLTLTVLLE